MFSWRVAVLVPWPVVGAGVCFMGASTVAGGFYALFLLPSSTEDYWCNHARRIRDGHVQIVWSRRPYFSNWHVNILLVSFLNPVLVYAYIGTYFYTMIFTMLNILNIYSPFYFSQFPKLQILWNSSGLIINCAIHYYRIDFEDKRLD